jgi:hypothetical protein
MKSHWRRSLWVGGLALLAVQLGPMPARAAGGDDGGYTGPDNVYVWLEESIDAAGGAPGTAVNGSRRAEWDYAYLCADTRYRHDVRGGCPDGSLPRIEYCDDGSEATPPLWVRWETPVGSGRWGEWSLYRGYTCGGETTFEFHLRRAWEAMPIAPHRIGLQPDTGWIFSNVPTIAMVDRDPRELPTTILGRAVLIRANPGVMTWEWGDGGRTITYDRGAPYPNQTLTHTYAYFEGDVIINLTSTWTGEYSLDGGATWRPAPGTATTTSTPVPLTVYNPHSHVVTCDLDGNCRPS